MVKRYHSVLLSSLRLALLVFFVQATEIKWKGTSSGDDPAKTAPKSQRYWDTHKITRPDYAKTDAEIAKENGDIYPAYTTIAVAILFIAGAIYLVRGRGSGHRLGASETGFIGTSPPSVLFVQESTDERAREARLARFEAPNVKESKID